MENQGNQGNQGWGNQGAWNNYGNAWGNNMQGHEWVNQQVNQQHFDMMGPNSNINLNDIIE